MTKIKHMPKVASENSKSVAETVRDLIEFNLTVKDALKSGIANYSAVARKLLPVIRKELKETVNTETIIVAIRRYVESAHAKPLPDDIVKILANSTLSLKSDIAYVTLNRINPGIFSAAQELYEKIDWQKGEIMYLVQGIGEVMVVLDNKNLEKLSKLVSKRDILEKFEKMALITMKSPAEAAYVSGVLHFVIEKLAEREISIELVSTPSETHFLISEENVTETYEILKRLVGTSRKILNSSNRT